MQDHSISSNVKSPNLGGKVNFTSEHLNEFANKQSLQSRKGLSVVLIEKRFLNLTPNLS